MCPFIHLSIHLTAQVEDLRSLISLFNHLTAAVINVHFEQEIQPSLHVLRKMYKTGGEIFISFISTDTGLE